MARRKQINGYRKLATVIGEVNEQAPASQRANTTCLISSEHHICCVTDALDAAYLNQAARVVFLFHNSIQEVNVHAYCCELFVQQSSPN